jgi:hypothetical protein
MAGAEHLRKLRQALNQPTSLGELSDRLGREGTALLLTLISLPFLQPIPLAGLGTPIGILLMALGVQLCLNHPSPALPRFVRNFQLETATALRLLTAAEKLMSFVERFSRRRVLWMAQSNRAYGVAIIILGLILATPVFVPFGNPITGAPLALIGIALLEEDGLFGLLGILGTGLTIAYHAAFARLIWNGLKALL